MPPSFHWTASDFKPGVFQPVARLGSGAVLGDRVSHCGVADVGGDLPTQGGIVGVQDRLELDLLGINVGTDAACQVQGDLAVGYGSRTNFFGRGEDWNAGPRSWSW